MTTDGACFRHEGYIAMLWPLSWVDDNWRSMINTKGIYYHAMAVVMRRWQLTVHDSYLRNVQPCSVRCHKGKTTDGSCLIKDWYITMLWPFLWDDDDWRSMLHRWMIYHNARPFSWHDDKNHQKQIYDNLYDDKHNTDNRSIDECLGKIKNKLSNQAAEKLEGEISNSELLSALKIWTSSPMGNDRSPWSQHNVWRHDNLRCSEASNSVLETVTRN